LILKSERNGKFRTPKCGSEDNIKIVIHYNVFEFHGRASEPIGFLKGNEFLENLNN
jgi:hypothetical protein